MLFTVRQEIATTHQLTIVYKCDTYPSAPQRLFGLSFAKQFMFNDFYREVWNKTFTWSPRSYYNVPYNRHSCNATMELMHYLLLSLGVVVPSIQEIIEASFFRALPTTFLHCLDSEEHTSSYLDCGIKTTRELVYNYAFVYESKCHVCRSPSETPAVEYFSENLLPGPHYIRGEEIEFF